MGGGGSGPDRGERATDPPSTAGVSPAAEVDGALGRIAGPRLPEISPGRSAAATSPRPSAGSARDAERGADEVEPTLLVPSRAAAVGGVGLPEAEAREADVPDVEGPRSELTRAVPASEASGADLPGSEPLDTEPPGAEAPGAEVAAAESAAAEVVGGDGGCEPGQIGPGQVGPGPDDARRVGDGRGPDGHGPDGHGADAELDGRGGGDRPIDELRRRAADLRRDLLERFERMCRDGHEAEDVVQEALLRGFRSLASRREPVELRPWLSQIARRVLYDRARREGRRRYLEAEDGVDAVPAREREPWELTPEPPGPFDPRACTAAQAEWAVRDGLAALRVGDRDLLVDHYERGLSCPQIAARDGERAQTVKVRLFRARRRLAKQLERRLVLDASGGGRS